MINRSIWARLRSRCESRRPAWASVNRLMRPAAVKNRTLRPCWQARSPSRGQMGFAGAAVAHEDQVLLLVQVTPLGQVQDPGLVEGGQRREVELVQALERGKPGHPEPFLVGVFLPLCA